MKPFETLMALASEHRPDAEPGPGFDTRLQARIRELREASGDLGTSFSALFTQWLWRTSWGLTPVVAILVLFFALFYGLNLPEGAGSLVYHLANLLPVDGF